MKRALERLRSEEGGFTVIELMVALMILMIAMGSLTYVLTNSLMDAGYSRQRAAALNVANQTIEELRSLVATRVAGVPTGWNAYVLAGTADATLATDGNVKIAGTSECYQGRPLVVGGVVGDATACAATSSGPWQDPSCLRTSEGALPAAASLVAPAPLNPHQHCYTFNNQVYGVDVYLTGSAAGAVAPPLTASVVVTWAKGFRNGLEDHVVTSTELSPCMTVGSLC